MIETPDLLDAFDCDRRRLFAIVDEAVQGAEDGELFLERRRSQRLRHEDGRLVEAGDSLAAGFGLRAAVGARVAFASATGFEEAALRRAAATVSGLRHGGDSADMPPPSTNHAPYRATDPVSDPDLQARIALCRWIEESAYAAEPRLRRLTVEIESQHQRVAIVRPGGWTATDERPLVRLSVTAVLAEGDRHETGSFGFGGRGSFADIATEDGWRHALAEAIRIAAVGLEARAAPAGVLPVVLAPGWPGILLHEAVGHGLEGDLNRKGISAFAGLKGERIAAPGVTVVDDGTLSGRRGSLAIDDEGSPAGRTVLIEDGRLTGYMQDRLNARLMGMAPTGNGRRQSFAHRPMPRMTNTFMLSGEAPPEALIAAAGEGLYAASFGGGQVDITSGTFAFNCTEAYRIVDGRLAEPVKGAVLIGSGTRALTGIRMVGNDLCLDPGIGQCGKYGQLVPVGVGLPTVLIDGLTVGGTA